MNGRWCASIAALILLAPWHSLWAQDVKVYRCTRANGSVAHQGTPCDKSATQTVQMHKRPPDAPPPPPPAPVATDAPQSGAGDEAAPEAPPEGSLPEAAPEGAPESNPPPPEAPAAPPPPPPKPLYTCITHDGQQYTNTTGVGETRWVPLWVLGMGPKPAPGERPPVGTKPPKPSKDKPGVPAAPPGSEALGAGTWVRDTCYRVSGEELCRQRASRISELRRKRGQAQANARIEINAEIDGLLAQQRNECP